MNTQQSTLRVLSMGAFKSIMIALLVSTSISAVNVQENLQTRVPRIEAMQLNHAFVSPLAPQATFESAWVVHRVKYNNKWWMAIHVKFRVKNALSTPCRMTAYFYDDSDGEPLVGDYPDYNQGGYVSAGKDLTPAYNDAAYADFQIYIPYEALNLEGNRGDEYSLKFFLNLRDESTKRDFAKSTWYKFSLKY